MNCTVTSHGKVRSLEEADNLAIEAGCTHRSDLLLKGAQIGYCYWINHKGAKEGTEKAVYYSNLKVLDVWTFPKNREPLPEDAQPIGERR